MKNNYCSKCQRLKNPEKYAYQTLKDNAKRRGKEFDISFEDFKIFCVKTSYIAKKGRKKDCLHVDRILETSGYTKENIQALTNTENVRKYLKYYWDGYKMNYKFNTIKDEHIRSSEGNNDQPF